MGGIGLLKTILLLVFFQAVVLSQALADGGIPVSSSTNGPSPADGETDGGLSEPIVEEDQPGFPPNRVPEITLSVTPKEASVGEVVYWRLGIVRHPEVQVRLGTEASFGDLEVRSKQVSEREPSGDLIHEVMEVQLIGFEPGVMEIPAQVLTAVDKGGQLAELETDGATVQIKSLIANEPEPKLKEDTGPGEKVYVKDYLILWILGILVGILLVAAVTLLARRLIAMRRTGTKVFVPPPRPAEEIALEKLAMLRESNLLEEGQIKRFHVQLSEAVREYLGNRYLFDSLELSSEELSFKLKNTTIASEDFDTVGEFLGVTDLVKFAKVVLSHQESLGLLDQSVAFVEKTTPRPVSTSDNGGDRIRSDHAE
jgi:hypothetical protein